MAVRQIPEGSVEIQTGLWLYSTDQVLVGTILKFLYSSEGYCFYDNTDEIYDEEGNLVPSDEVLPSQRMYMQYCGLGVNISQWTTEQINARFISVPVDPSYEIVSRPNNHETI